MSFNERLLSFKIQLATGNFAGSSSGQTTIATSSANTATIGGVRASARIQKAGTPSLGTAHIQIFGLPLTMTNQLSTLGLTVNLVPRNVITVLAGTNDNDMSTVFQGTITQAWSEFRDAPEVPFNIEAHTLGTESIQSITPQSFTGSSDVATIMGNLAKQANCSFENNGVSAKLANPYLYGSVRDQAQQCADAANVNWTVDDGVLAIWPNNGSRQGDTPIIAPPPQGTMVGYPSFTAYGIHLKNEYDPRFKFGSKVRVRSSLQRASGEWTIITLDHDLSTMMPGGEWFSEIGAYNSGFGLQIK